MLIKCPRCQARAKLPDSKEGAKVKCGECGRVYLAAPLGAKNVHNAGANTGTIVGIGVAVVALFVFIALRMSNADEPAKAAIKSAPIVAAEPEPEADELGWSGASIQLAVRIHERAEAHDPSGVRSLLDVPRIWALRQEAIGAGSAQFAALTAPERQELADEYADEIVSGESAELIADWRPYDGEVVALSDDEVTLRLATTPSSANLADDAQYEKRFVEWRLAKDTRGRWRAFHWERYISPEEARRIARAARQRATRLVTLSDGSVVREREPESLAHLDDTHADVRLRIDELYATMIDLNLTKETTRARDALVEIGRPTIPILLTGLWATPLDSEDNAIIANTIVIALRDITDQYMGYEPQVAVGSATGTTEERRASAIKQWFAWWYTNQGRFQRKEKAKDGLEGLIELTEKEKRWLERHKD